MTIVQTLKTIFIPSLVRANIMLILLSVTRYMETRLVEIVEILTTIGKKRTF